MFSNQDDVVVPKIHWDLTSERVLTMEFMHGCKINNLECLRDKGIDSEDALITLNRIFARQIYLEGFIHADPHMGNVFCRKKASDGKVQIILLDHALYTQFRPEFRRNYCQLWNAFFSMDEKSLSKYCKLLGVDKIAKNEMKLSPSQKLFATLATSRAITGQNQGFLLPMSSQEEQFLKKYLRSNVQLELKLFPTIPLGLFLLLKAK